jgi:hypothetical protein
MSDFFIGLILGLTCVGLTTQRTLEIIDGKFVKVFLLCLPISLTYYLNMQYVVSDNISGYVGFSLGAAIITSYLAYKRKK